MFSAAGEGPSPMPFVVYGMAAVFFIVVLVFFVILQAKQYKRCPPNRLLVVFGKTPGQMDRACIVLHGGAVFVWPLLQDYAYLSLEPMQIEIPKALRGQAVDLGLKLPETWSFAIGVDPELMQAAALRLLGLPPHEIEHTAIDLIVGRLERKVDSLQSSSAPADSASIIEKWKNEVDRSLAQVGLVTLGYR